ncbi:hypothetical protein [Actinophytocola glycyrrhizae]|uniref:Outer membrane channel protein CpnT-like N-terminal domain-containing protein n=1 Tax=Actinophytocola glycyrrhizae TaxID=2044873 RepID=A0ABV9SFV2_9PSEU
MGLPEPVGLLWTEVKGVHDPWPPDDEQAALDLGAAWQQAAATAHTAAEQAVTAGGNAHAAWQDGAGRLLDGTIRAYGEQVVLLEQGMLMHGDAARRYGEQVRSVKQTIASVISTYQPYYDLLSNPAFGEAGRAMRDWLVQNVAGRLRDMVLGAAGQLGPRLSASGPDADFEEKSAEGGKFGEARAWAELFKLGAQNADGTFKGEAVLGAEASRSHSLTNEGLKAQLEAAAGLKLKGEYKDAIGPNGLVGYGAEAEAFAGGKAGAGLSLGPDGFEAKAEAFAGGRLGGKVHGDVGGIGLGLTAEGWAGPGAEAGVTARNENGVWTLGAAAGASPVLGGKLGVELRVDTNKVVETAGHVRQAVEDGIAEVGRGYETVRQGVEDVGGDVGEGVESARRGVEDVGRDVGRGIEDMRDRVGRLF